MAWAKPKLFYAHNLSSMTATSTEAGYNPSNLIDMKEGTFWKSNHETNTQYIAGADPGVAVAVDYLAIAGHNLNTINSTIDLQYSNDNFVADINSAFTPYVPSNDLVLVKEFSQVSERYWRLKLSGHTAAPLIAISIWGEMAVLDYATLDFDPNNQNKKANINVTQAGILAGVHEHYTERNINIVIEYEGTNCFNILNQLWENVGLSNFFFGWETTEHPTEVYLMRFNTNNFTNPFTNQGLYRTLTLNLVGRKEN